MVNTTASRLPSGDHAGALLLPGLGLNTLPLATVDASVGHQVAVLPFFVAQGNASGTTFFLNATLAPVAGSTDVEYFVDFYGAAPVFSF